MNHLRLNLLNGRWVTMVADRAERPSDFAPRTPHVEADPSQPCPFCPESQTDVHAALERRDEHGWRQRIVANLYPAFDGDEPFAVHNLGPVHIEARASGVHEVFILSPDHHGRPEGDTDDDAKAALSMLRDRLAEHAATPAVRYTQAIINYGREAGASLSHPHGQLLGLPFVPGEIVDEERAFARFEGGCVLCATAEAELVDNKRVVLATDDVLVACPYWSGSPYEMLVIPRHHQSHVTEAPSDSLDAVAVAMRDAIGALRARHGDVAYNAVLHTAPHQHRGPYHWHLHLFPSLVTTAGFERGTGVLVNIVTPEAAAAELREAFAAH